MPRIMTGLLICLVLLSSGALSAAPFAYISNYGDDSISVIDTATNAVIATIPSTFYYTLGPRGVVVDPTGRWVYVAIEQPSQILGLGPTLVRIDTSSNMPTGGVNTTANLTGSLGVAVNTAGTRVWVANEQGDAAAVDTASFRVVTRAFNVGGFVSGIAVNPAGTRVYVTTHSSNGLGADGVGVVDAT